MTENNKPWPFKFPPRKSQAEAIEWAIEQTDFKYIILEAPVGTGKSNIGLALSKYLGKRTSAGDSYILTPQRILQKQYEESFAKTPEVHLVSLYGRNNYSCRQKGTTCDIGSIVKPRCSRCPYAQVKKQSKDAPNVVMNYKLGLILFAYSEFYEKRNLLILDECHTLEQHLVDFDSVNATEWRAKKFGLNWKVAKDIKEAVKWFDEHYLETGRTYLQKLGQEVEVIIDKKESEITRSDIKKLKEYDKLQDHLDELEMLVFASKKDPTFITKWVYTSDTSIMTFKRLTGAHSFKKIIDPMANKILFMSSTILNKEGFCRDLGIDPNEAAFLSLDSDFPESNRPVIYMPQMKMNAAWMKDENNKGRRKMINAILDILEQHDGQSGIIHTGNFAIAKWLVDELESEAPQQIFHHNPDSGDDRNAVINAFQSSPKPGILISPSSTEGLDLKDDLGRFAIFVKVPFGFLGDKWIKRRLEMSNEWYQRRALIDVIQGGGRVVRGTDDWGKVYILDQSWGFLYSKTKGMIPDWWNRAYTTD